MALKVAFVGCGNIANHHLKAAQSTGRVTITALIDPNEPASQHLASALADHDGEGKRPRSFRSLAEALAADASDPLFDACDVMVPCFSDESGDLHETVALEALRAGKHVLLEKPVCVTPEAGERLASLHATRPASQVLAVAENAQFWPEVLAAKSAIERGDIGDVLSVRAKYWESADGEWAGDYLPGTWRCDASKLPAASFTYDGTTHFIRPLRMWLGEVARVAGTTGRTLAHMPGVSMSQHVLVFASGVSATLETLLAPSAISDQPFFTIQGTKGEIVIGSFDGGCTLHTSNAEPRELCKVGWDGGYEGEYADFAAAVLDGTRTKNGVAQAIADLRVVISLFTAAENQAWAAPGATEKESRS